ncbi:MAG TPA: hypothetical protein VHP34_03230 [Alphaproteobacteria bacterium]|jgi:hypothetical protein|nr:hypothetical protein [Alphaproteobacteria bacterium]
MSLLKKIYCSLTFRCFTSLAIGLGIVTFIAVELASLAFDGAMLSDAETAEVVLIETPFPENEDMLREMAQSLERSHALNEIEAAAGE